MRRVVIFTWALVLILGTIIHGSPLPLSRAKRVEQYSGKVNDLKQKLAQLQEMLEDMNDNKETEGGKEKNLKKPATTIGSILARGSREPMRSQYDNEANPNRQEKVKLLAARLADGDRESLKMLENILSSVRTERERQSSTDTTGDDLGEHRENAREETGVRTIQNGDKARQEQEAVERDIVSLLRKFREQTTSTSRKLSHDERPNYRPRQTIEEGHFGDFRQEVLHAVENRLLDDLKMALHSGFTVKEIITDLESTDGEWHDSKKNEIERELDTLKRLHDNVS